MSLFFQMANDDDDDEEEEEDEETTLLKGEANPYSHVYNTECFSSPFFNHEKGASGTHFDISGCSGNKVLFVCLGLTLLIVDNV